MSYGAQEIVARNSPVGARTVAVGVRLLTCSATAVPIYKGRAVSRSIEWVWHIVTVDV